MVTISHNYLNENKLKSKIQLLNHTSRISSTQYLSGTNLNSTDVEHFRSHRKF